MGALTSNSKRDPFSNSPDFHISKKPRLSFMHNSPKQTLRSSYNLHSIISRNTESNPKETLGFYNSTVSRISQYPETTSKLRREVHAPCRMLKFGLSRPQDTYYNLKKDMGNLLSSLDFTRRSAYGALRYFLKGKEVIDVDEEPEKSKKEVASDDSSIEEIQVIEEDGREGRSMVFDRSSREGVMGKNDDNDVKIVEERSVITMDGNIGVKSAEKKLDSLVLNGQVDVSNVEVYKKLLETAERRNGRLQVLDSEIEFNQKKLSLYQSTRPVEKPVVQEIPVEPFIPLTKEEKSEINRALSPSYRRKVLVTHESSNIEITGEILRCLAPKAWLNDEVINLYLELLKEREKRDPQKFLKCHFFNTFFYKKLTSGDAKRYDYKAVKRWTTERKLGYFLIDCDKIFIPVHREIHWCLAIINKKDQKFQYLDSLKGRDAHVLEHLAKYYVEEVKDKSKKDIDVSNWEREFLEDVPEQQNGYDCGVFMIKYTDFYSRDIGLCFGQEHMHYFRMRTAKEILRLRAD